MLIGPRTGIVVLLGAVLVGGALYLGRLAARSVVGWLHAQPQYQLPFDQIELVPPPPAWYRAGAKGFLDRVRRRANLGENVSVLDLTPERLALAFRDAWVEEVLKVAYSPGKVHVYLRYREPVGMVVLADGGQQLVDEYAVLLASDDVDPVRLGPLIRISAPGLEPPADPQPGVTWKSRTRPGGLESVNESIVAAAGLAGFISKKQRASTIEKLPALKVTEIMVGAFEKRGLFMVNAERAVIWWRYAPKREPPGEPSAEVKWAMLEEWQRTETKRLLPEPDYWGFSETGVVRFCTHGDPTHRSLEPRERRDGKTQLPDKPAGAG
jgi:hypothetical protein